MGEAPTEEFFTRNHGRGRRGTSENEKLTGGVLSGRQQQLKWLPVGLSKVWWSQRDLNQCFNPTTTSPLFFRGFEHFHHLRKGCD